MKTLNKYFVFILVLVITSPFAFGQTLNVMTYNIRFDNPGDGENKWENRKEEMVSLLQFYKPELFGLQEGLYHQLEYIDGCLPNYAYVGVGRNDGNKKGEFTAIFYDTTKVSIISEATFWLSESGDTSSVGWDAALERICTYGLFELKESKEKFCLFNAHFDHVGVQAREQSAYLILNKIEKINSENFPVIMLGDLNSEPGSKPIETFKEKLQDAWDISKEPPYGPLGTFNNFQPCEVVDRRIDYIFVSGLNVRLYAHIDDRRANNFYISDHLPVLSKVEF